ncbi:MAG: hypothetical protein HY670_04050 [Chloroflexi bacterium]|nr:hypothetical protein [Chloroflexota bacterium]
MTDWQITATTIYCAAVHDEVTLMVFRDWSTKCTGHKKYVGKASGRNSRNHVHCIGLECQHIVEYRAKLQAEEAEKHSVSNG